MKMVEIKETTTTKRIVPEGFCADLVRTRIAIGLTYKEFAKEMGINCYKYKDIESGRINVGKYLLQRLAAVLKKHGYSATREIKISKVAK